MITFKQFLLEKKKVSLPVWANSTTSENIFRQARAGVLVGGHKLEIVATPPRKHLKGYGGTWKIDPTGKITVIIEKSLFDAYVEKKAPWGLLHLVQHEYIEAKHAIALAREKYPNKSPYVMAETDDVLGGLAHYEAIKSLDRMSEDEYDRNIQLETEFLGWKP